MFHKGLSWHVEASGISCALLMAPAVRAVHVACFVWGADRG